jgi:hypothetical protein
MAEKRTVELEIKDNSKSLKAQLKEAVMEVQKLSDAYGATSAQAIEAAKRAGELKDKIGDAADLVKSFNPDAKFNALSKSIGGVLDGFQAFEGALGLIGVEGEQVQATLLKVQSAMALSQGLQGLGEARDSFKQLGGVIKDSYQSLLRFIAGQQVQTVVAGEVAVATGAEAVATEGAAVAQLSLNAAMKANPIGLILGLVVAATAAIVGYMYATREATDEEKKAEKAKKSRDEANKKAIQTQKESAEFIGKETSQYAMLISQLKGTNSGSKERVNLIKKINSEYGTTLKNMSSEKGFQDQLNASLANYIQYQKQKFAQGILNSRAETLQTKRAIVEQQLQQKEMVLMNKSFYVDASGMGKGNSPQERAKNAKYIRDTEAEVERLNGRIRGIDATFKMVSQQSLALANSLSGQFVPAVVETGGAVDTNTASNEALIQSLLDLQIANNEVGKSETQLLDIKKQRDLDALQATYNNSLKDEAAIKALADAKVLIELKYNQDIAVIKAKFRQEEITKEDAQFALHEEATYSEKEKEIAALVKTYEDKFALAGDNAALEQELIIKQKEELKLIQEKYAAKDLETTTKTEEKKQAIEAATLEQKLTAVQDTFATIANLAELFAGDSEAQQLKAFKIQKAANIAGALVNTYSSAVSSYNSLSGIPVVGPVLGGAAAAAAVTAGLLNIKKIKQTEFGGGDSAGGGGSNMGGIDTSGGGGGGVVSPTFNVVGNNGFNQLAQLQQQPVQAYVVSGEVTSAQALDRNRITNATL